jgi:hypothetical protein
MATGRSLDEARAAQSKAQAQLTRIKEVNGIGITRVGDGFALKVNLSAPLKPGATVPSAIDGVPVHTEVVGTIRPRRAG